MNTLRTRPPKRWRSKLPSPPDRPTGKFKVGLGSNPTYLLHLGQIATAWPHVDDAMIHVFRDLLGAGTNAPVRQVFKSIVNAQIRIRIMRNLLEMSRLNVNRGKEYDEIISEFDALNDIRNAYLHGLWFDYPDVGEVWLAAPTVDDFRFAEQRRVPLQEIAAVETRIQAFAHRLTALRNRGWDVMREPSQEPLSPHAEATP